MKNIVTSEKEPLVTDLWMKSDGLYQFGPNGWEKIAYGSGGSDSGKLAELEERLNKVDDSDDPDLDQMSEVAAKVRKNESSIKDIEEWYENT